MDETRLRETLRAEANAVTASSSLQPQVVRRARRRMARNAAASGVAAVALIGIVSYCLPRVWEAPADSIRPASGPQTAQDPTAGTVDGVAWDVDLQGGTSCVDATFGDALVHTCFPADGDGVMGPHDDPLDSSRGRSEEVTGDLVFGVVTSPVADLYYEGPDGSRAPVALPPGSGLREFGFWVARGAEGRLIATDDEGRVVAAKPLRVL